MANAFAALITPSFGMPEYQATNLQLNKRTFTSLGQHDYKNWQTPLNHN